MSFERADVPRNGMRPETLRERLLRQREVGATGCWNWTGQRTQSGYGVTSWNGKHVRAHRASFSVFIGGIEPGMLVCHRCDNPLCINPDHLFIGSPADNVRDMVRKGRGKHAKGLAAARLKAPKGEKHWQAVLTESDVLQIRELKRQGVTIRENAVNARLISAAPDLLVAAQLILRGYGVTFQDAGVRSLLANAIAKATGERL